MTVVCDGTGVMESHESHMTEHYYSQECVHSSVTSDLDSVHQSLRSGRDTFLHGFDFSINNVRSFSLHRNHGLVEHKKVSGSF